MSRKCGEAVTIGCHTVTAEHKLRKITGMVRVLSTCRTQSYSLVMLQGFDMYFVSFWSCVAHLLRRALNAEETDCGTCCLSRLLGAAWHTQSGMTNWIGLTDTVPCTAGATFCCHS